MTEEVEPRSEDGKTPAAWATVMIMLIGFAVGTLGVCLAWWWMLFAGIGLVVVGGIVGKVMGAMGLGQYSRSHEPSAAG